MGEYNTSFRAPLVGTISDFLRDEGMSCHETGEALVQLATSLSEYREEGDQLRPRVVICDDLSATRGILQASDAIELGYGPRGASTLKQALKRSAPLAQRGWIMYIHRDVDLFRYGVFREPFSPTSLDVQDAVSEIGDDVKILFAVQAGLQTVEMRGANGSTLTVRFSGAESGGMSPRDAVDKLSASATCAVETGIREPTASYLRTSLSNALHAAHGCLITVVPNIDSGCTVPDALAEDGTFFPSPVDLASLVQQMEENTLQEAQDMLRAYSDLLAGMLQSDGIVVLGDGAHLLGYNAFVRFSAEGDAAPRKLVGGARRRAFQVLRGLVEQGELVGALFQSSDGIVECEVSQL